MLFLRLLESMISDTELASSYLETQFLVNPVEQIKEAFRRANLFINQAYPDVSMQVVTCILIGELERIPNWHELMAKILSDSELATEVVNEIDLKGYNLLLLGELTKVEILQQCIVSSLNYYNRIISKQKHVS